MSGFVSYAQHGEDVVIWRALGHVSGGFYVDVGAADPSVDSVTRALYERGWRGVHVEALSEYAEALRAARVGDVVVEAAAGAEPGVVTFYGVPGTGLSTVVAEEASVAQGRGFGVRAVTVPVRTLDDVLSEHVGSGREIHVLKVDVEGAEEAVLRGAALARWRPWVVVIEATRPGSVERTSDRWEHLVLEAGYVRCMFDGLNLWFCRADRVELVEALSYPACPLDEYRRAGAGPGAGAAEVRLARATQAQQLAERRLRDKDVQLRRAQRRLAELQGSPWWRMTRPGRAVVHRAKRVWRRRAGGVGSVPVEPAPAAAAPAVPVAPAPAPAPVAPVVPGGTPERVVLERVCAVLAADGVACDPADEAKVWALVGERLTGPDRAGWLWALHVAHTGTLPDEAALECSSVALERGGPDAALRRLHGLAREVPVESWVRTAPLEVVDRPLVDVSQTATRDLHTGIQRVVRETVPRWHAAQGCELVVLDDVGTFRRCDGLERDRVLAWPPPPGQPPAVEQARAVVLPWRTRVLVPELFTSVLRAALLRALAAGSGSSLGFVVYDMTPVTCAEDASAATSGGFATYLSAVKHAGRVSAISATVAREFEQYFGMLAGQGLAAPPVRAQLLPAAPRSSGSAGAAASLPTDPALPLVLQVSVIYPRKNQLRTLRAAERLWKEGLRFELLFIGGGAGLKRQAFDEAVDELRAAGRPVHVLADVDDETLWSAYRQARCTVYVSLVEGYGLPAAESLAVGTPVVLTRHGSMAEIGADGGALMVDPRDVDEIADAMRRLLLDDALHAELSAAALRRPRSTWDDYARQTWDWLVEDVAPTS